MTGPQRLRRAFSRSHPALIAYVPLGDPRFSTDILDTYLDTEVDVLEVGLPSPDPYGDGPTMARSMRLAAGAGVDGDVLTEILSPWLAQARRRPAIVWMTYADADLRHLARWARAGVIDSLLVMGTPPASLAQRLSRVGLGRCQFLSWEPAPDEVKRASTATGYLMVPARPGVTGTDLPPGDPKDLIATARRLNPAAPVVSGFGVSDPDSAVRLAEAGADGVVVGTACLEALESSGTLGLATRLSAISKALAATRHQGVRGERDPARD